jgi:hypothetical protein
MLLAFAARLLANAADPIMNSRRETKDLDFAIFPLIQPGLLEQCITNRGKGKGVASIHS